MAGGALIQIERLPARFPAAGIFRQGSGPGYIVGVDVKDRGFRVHGRAAPFRATVKAREYDRWLADGERKKLASATELPELLDRPSVSLGSAGGQHVFGETLAR